MSTTITKNRWLRPAACLVVAAAAAVLAGCGPKYIRASTNIPTPLVAKIPITIALFIPTEFSTYVHKEERWSTNWNVALGGAQTEGLTRLLNAMFERVVMVDSVNAGAQLGPDVKAILEPSIEDVDVGELLLEVQTPQRIGVASGIHEHGLPGIERIGHEVAEFEPRRAGAHGMDDVGEHAPKIGGSVGQLGVVTALTGSVGQLVPYCRLGVAQQLPQLVHLN